jgi:hypothetical protein
MAAGFHSDCIAVLADFVNGANVGMVQCRRSTSFTTKPFECLRVAGYILWQKFQGYEATKLGILSLIDNTHPTAAEPLQDAVVRYGLADH